MFAIPGLTDIPGLKVGVAADLQAATGVTVVLAEAGARAAVDVRGSAPGTRETDLLRPGQLVDQVQAIALAGEALWTRRPAGSCATWKSRNGVLLLALTMFLLSPQRSCLI